jgi:hypothetical protein
MSQCLEPQSGRTPLYHDNVNRGLSENSRGKSVDNLTTSKIRRSTSSIPRTKQSKLTKRSLTVGHLLQGPVQPDPAEVNPSTPPPPASCTSLTLLEPVPAVDVQASGGTEAAVSSSGGQLDFRSRLQNLALIFTLPHLVMLANLQKLIGIRTGLRPTIQPNDYMDNLLTSAKATMKERGLNSVELPDQQVGVALYNGKMTGLDNLTRSGDALLEAETDHFLLSFAIEANDVKATYWWKKQRLK